MTAYPAADLAPSGVLRMRMMVLATAPVALDRPPPRLSCCPLYGRVRTGMMAQHRASHSASGIGGGGRGTGGDGEEPEVGVADNANGSGSPADVRRQRRYITRGDSTLSKLTVAKQ